MTVCSWDGRRGHPAARHQRRLCDIVRRHAPRPRRRAARDAGAAPARPRRGRPACARPALVAPGAGTRTVRPRLLDGRARLRRGLRALALGHRAVAGAALVVLNGVPGVTLEILPRWQGDVLLVLSGVAYASYSLLGRTVLSETNAAAITTRSIIWGAVVMAPLAGLEWAAGARPSLTPSAIVGTLYLALVISAGAYLVWNWALARVEASRAAPFLTIQPVVGALLGAVVLGEPVTRFTAMGGGLVVLGLWMTVTGRR